MIKRITLLMAMLFTVGSFSPSVFAQEEAGSGGESTESSSGEKPAGGSAGGEPECD